MPKGIDLQEFNPIQSNLIKQEQNPGAGLSDPDKLFICAREVSASNPAPGFSPFQAQSSRHTKDGPNKLDARVGTGEC